MEQNQQIEREVQRRVSGELRRHNEEVTRLTELVKEQQEKLIYQHDLIRRITGEPCIFGIVTHLKNDVDPNLYQVGDSVIVSDPQSQHHNAVGRITHDLPDNLKAVDMGNGFTERFNLTQLRLAEKDDGTSAVVAADGKHWEVKGVADLDCKVGDLVKVMSNSKQVVGLANWELDFGPVCSVQAITPEGVEVGDKGEKRLVQNPKALVLTEGDRVCVDPSFVVITKKLQQDPRQRYKLTSELTVTWDQIGGLEEAKQTIRDAIELPTNEPELCEYYGIKKSRGAVLYGPPGCGKTMFAKAVAKTLAELHGGEAIASGYIFVKSPEILDKWVGNTEAEIRNLFDRARKHFHAHHYPATLVFDEADAIMPQRGTRRSSDVADTIVPMFLGEMDGIDDEQTRCNPFVLLLTNRVDLLDPALIRPGRISHHIKIERPNEYTALDIFEIHSGKLPFVGDRKTILAVTSSDLFGKGRLLYRVNNEHDFTLGDAVNGAMIEQVVEEAKMVALHRDRAEKTKSGVGLADFRQGVDKIYQQQQGLNHAYDLHDFAEKKHIQAKDMTVTRCFGAA